MERSPAAALRKAGVPHLSPFLSSADFKGKASRSVRSNSDGRTSRSKKGPLPPLSDHNSKARFWEHRYLVSLPLFPEDRS